MKLPLVFLGLSIVLMSAHAIPAPDSAPGGRTPVVIELFTSEGCSSCPPADHLLEALDQQQPLSDVDLIVLSEHVDYWNNGGWTDPYSSKFFTTRQSRYAEKFGLESIYTPQRVIDGQFEGVGSNAASLKTDVKKAAAASKVPVTLTNISRKDNQLMFHAAAAGGGEPATLYIALAADRVRSEVSRGENAGRSLTHVAVVRSLKPIGSLKGGSDFSKDITLKLPAMDGSLTPSMRLVAFLQVDTTQKIIGAAQCKL
jgi:hypothetical protein